MIKTISRTAAVATIAFGLLFGAFTAHAGFFDWFNQTPLNQEAQALKSLQKEEVKDVKSFTRSSFEKKAEPVQIIEKAPVAESKSPAVNFFQSIFSRQSAPVQNVEQKSVAPTTPAARFGNTVFNPLPQEPISTALVIGCGPTMTVEECEDFCGDIGGTSDASGGGGCLVDNPDSTALVGGNVGTVNDLTPGLPGNALVIQCGGSMTVEECEEFCIDIGGNPSASSTGNCLVDNPDDTAVVSNPNPGFSPSPELPVGALVIQCGESMTAEECEEFCIDIGGNPSASSTGNCLVDNPDDTAVVSNPSSNPNPRPGNTVPWYDQKLRKGDVSLAVRELQKFLKQQGYLSGGADGIYGNMTAKALRKFQQEDIGSVGRQILTTGAVFGSKTGTKVKEVLGVNSSRPNTSEDASNSGGADVPPQDTGSETACDIDFRYAPWGNWVEFLTDSEMFELYRLELTNSSNANCVITDFDFSFVYETGSIFIEDLQLYNRDPFVYPASQKVFGQYSAVPFSGLSVELGPGEVKEYSLYATVSNPGPGDEIGTKLDSVTANGIEFEVAPATQHLPYYSN